MTDAFDKWAFDKWINGMSDSEYEEWLESKATTSQEEKAVNIRQPLSEQELREMEQEQISGVIEVYDNRQLKPKERTVDIEQRKGERPQIKKPEIETPQELEKVIPTIQKPKLRERISNVLKGFLARFRRKKK